MLNNRRNVLCQSCGNVRNATVSRKCPICGLMESMPKSMLMLLTEKQINAKLDRITKRDN